MPSTNPPASVKLLATTFVRLLSSAKPLALLHSKPLGEASVTAWFDVHILQPTEDPLTIQQELRSPGSNVGSQRKHPNASEHCSFRPLAYTGELSNLPICASLYTGEQSAT
ncbi:hypothetical protein DPMN_124925 [Dreissena polymorpha]|uniref:Uncharacterized protein n=1 Tax=Dreissena polymorpha TaxID=45954 RepID=A0A9D4GT05_DREPO|nr:hypothetical protein DPMN_124925 [Dreissena polymorpha]